MSGARSWWLGQVCDCQQLTENTVTQRPGAAIVVNVTAGDSIYPFQVVKATVGTATISAYYNLFV